MIISRLRFKKFHKDAFNYLESEFIRNTRNSPQVLNSVLHQKKITKIEQEEWYENVYNKDNNWWIYLAYDVENGFPVSYINFKIDSIIHRRMNFDFFIPYEYIKNKYEKNIIKWATDNARVLEIDVHKLLLYVLTDNDKKIEIMYKNGFEIDGLITDFAYIKKEFKNVYVMTKILT